MSSAGAPSYASAIMTDSVMKNADHDDNNSGEKIETREGTGMDIDEEEERLSSWVIPHGAELIIKQLCAQEFLQRLLDGGRVDSSPVCSLSSSSSQSTIPTAIPPSTASASPTTAEATRRAAQHLQLSNDYGNERLKEEEAGEMDSNAMVTTPNGSNVDFAMVRFLIQNYPGICRSLYEFRWEGGSDVRFLYPLAMLCVLQPPLDIVKSAYKAYPAALTIAEPTKGCIPLHYACSAEGSLELVEFLLQEQPTTIQTKRFDGMLPLHLASYFKAPYQIVEYLYHQYPAAIKDLDHEEWTPLHAAARGMAPLSVVQALYKWHRPLALRVDDARRTPLHLSCMKRGDADVVKWLYQAAPAAMTMEDIHHLTPLFHAAKCQSVGTLQQLLRVMAPPQPMAAAEEPGVPPTNPQQQAWIPPSDHMGATLLHFAVAANTPCVVKYLCQTYPALVDARCTERMQYTALHVACLCDAPVANVKMLLHYYPHAILVLTGQGQDCVSIARKSQVSPALIDFLEQQMALHTWTPSNSSTQSSTRQA